MTEGMLAGFCSKLTSPFSHPRIGCFGSGHWMIVFDAGIGFPAGIFRRKATDATTGFSMVLNVAIGPAVIT
jgi:hypothetical protein